ncbi:flagellar motor protein MotB [Hydrogenivirga sp. 128-5-R1-1]|uniref:OmpA/MotB family protein n=1 Tax=Hydrogenivirga sp. 128-5-R1-1 TaxID=392423 RepID=UPI00015F1FA0|nr:flagellar motor protein MotB [Hydrogenivirga sp. 128-5-R1-1]EDP73850.1 flagellar motor protein MotB-like protein [Hydrogenivirga sp. 128-5-R1-1]
MARKKKEECPAAPAWLISFSDLMSLLLTFFILLYAMTVLDIKKLMKFLWYFQGERPLETTKTVAVIPPISMMKEDVAKIIKKRLERILPIYAYQIDSIENYVLIRLFNDIAFKEDSYQLTDEAKKALNEIAKKIKKYSGYFDEIRVVGHAYVKNKSKLPRGIKDAWDLSIKRAEVIADILIKNGIKKDKIVLEAYGNKKPIYRWKNPILQRMNDRVEIYLNVKQLRPDILKEKK